MHNSKGVSALVLIAMVAFPGSQRAMGQERLPRGKFLGSIWQRWTSESAAPASLAKYFDQLSPENVGKWGEAEPSKGNFRWETLDAMYAWAQTNNVQFKEHNFVWGAQQPGWVGGKEDVTRWIGTFLKRYGARLALIDVVNEPLHNKPGYRSQLGGDGSTGWDWVIWVFQTARDSAKKYAPNAKLILNDYSIISSNGATTSYLGIVNLLKERNLIDGIAEQAHGFEGSDTASMHANLDRLAATGLPLYISELDIVGGDEAQLAAYKRLFPLFWDHPAMKGITLWGYQEGTMWRGGSHLVRKDGSERPALTWMMQYVKEHPHLEASSTAFIRPLLPSHRIQSLDGMDLLFDVQGRRIGPGIKSGPIYPLLTR